eukprot:5203250-Pleurochrysis_carterae.AAC.1
MEVEAMALDGMAARLAEAGKVVATGGAAEGFLEGSAEADIAVAAAVAEERERVRLEGMG